MLCLPSLFTTSQSQGGRPNCTWNWTGRPPFSQEALPPPSLDGAHFRKTPLVQCFGKATILFCASAPLTALDYEKTHSRLNAIKCKTLQNHKHLCAYRALYKKPHLFHTADFCASPSHFTFSSAFSHSPFHFIIPFQPQRVCPKVQAKTLLKNPRFSQSRAKSCPSCVYSVKSE